jgi:hypothetical protein
VTLRSIAKCSYASGCDLCTDCTYAPRTGKEVNRLNSPHLLANNTQIAIMFVMCLMIRVYILFIYNSQSYTNIVVKVANISNRAKLRGSSSLSQASPSTTCHRAPSMARCFPLVCTYCNSHTNLADIMLGQKQEKEYAVIVNIMTNMTCSKQYAIKLFRSIGHMIHAILYSYYQIPSSPSILFSKNISEIFQIGQLGHSFLICES